MILFLLAQVAAAGVPASPAAPASAAPSIVLPDAPTVPAIPSLTKVDLLSLAGYRPSGCVGDGRKARIRLTGPNGSVFVSKAAYKASSILEPSPCEREEYLYFNHSTAETGRPTYQSGDARNCSRQEDCELRGVEAGSRYTREIHLAVTGKRR